MLEMVQQQLAINNEGEPEKLRVKNKKLLVKKMKDNAEEYAQQIRQLDKENKDLKEQIIQSHKQHLSQSQRITELSEEVERYKKIVHLLFEISGQFN